MIKTALIVPKGSKYGKNTYLKTFLEQNDIVSKFYGAWETPNLSLLTIAGLFPDDYELHFIDEDHGERIPFEEHFDLVLVTGMTQQINRAYEIIKAFRLNQCYTVIGGIHATIYPEEASKYADTVIIGEAEPVFDQFLNDFSNMAARKIYKAECFADIRKSPVPRYDLVNKSLYSSYSIQTTRGCPRTCSYCTLPVMYGSVYRCKSVEQVMSEIRAIKRIEPNPFIFFADDNMFVNRENSKKLIRAIEKEGIIWGTQTDLSVAEDLEILQLLKSSGCRWLFIGFENISRSGLELLDARKWKANLVDRYQKLIDQINRSGIYIWGSFMFGSDHDDSGVFENTLKFAIDNGIYSGSFTIMTPLPGTELFKQMEKNDRIIDYDWSRYTFWDVVYKPKLLTEEELAKGVAYLYHHFYSIDNTRKRMGNIKKLLKKHGQDE